MCRCQICNKILFNTWKSKSRADDISLKNNMACYYVGTVGDGSDENAIVLYG